MRPPADCTRPPVRPTRTRRGCGNEPPTTRRICARGAPVLGLQLLPQHHVGASRSRASVQFRQGHQPMRSAVERRAVRAFRRSSGSGTRPRRRVVSTTDRHRPRCGCPRCRCRATIPPRMTRSRLPVAAAVAPIHGGHPPTARACTPSSQRAAPRRCRARPARSLSGASPRGSRAATCSGTAARRRRSPSSRWTRCRRTTSPRRSSS
mmetsp:Transcript_20193/g.62736  ORF Transcript_20193/g.62736 Transcript_20193/m.62736 type:complete len:207 (-) Transcript_20193:240-860(-)